MSKRGRPSSGVFRVGAVTAPPGELVTGAVPVARLPGQGNLELPIALVHGKRPGPTLWVSAAVHGDEINGVEVVRELIELVSPAKLRGRLIAVPVVNVFGFANGSRYTPDRKDINRSFPGSPNGSLASRIACIFTRQVIAQSDYGIDLHTGAVNRTNVPQVRIDFGDRKLLKLARSFGAPLLLHSAPAKKTLRWAAARRGVPTLLYEAGEPNRFNRKPVKVGLRGVQRVMQELDMYDWRLATPSERSAEYRASQWIRSPRSGLFRACVKMGATVTKGQRLGGVGDTLNEVEIEVSAPRAGRIIGGAIGPIVHQGDALLHLASKRPPS